MTKFNAKIYSAFWRELSCWPKKIVSLKLCVYICQHKYDSIFLRNFPLLLLLFNAIQTVTHSGFFSRKSNQHVNLHHIKAISISLHTASHSLSFWISAYCLLFGHELEPACKATEYWIAFLLGMDCCGQRLSCWGRAWMFLEWCRKSRMLWSWAKAMSTCGTRW